MDVRTLFIFSTLVLCVNALAIHLTSFRVKTYRGFGYWTGFFALLAVAQVLLALRGLVPDLFSIVCGNLAAVTAVCLYAEGMYLFHELEGRSPNRVMIPIGALLIAGIVYFTYVEPNFSKRVVFSMAGIALLLWTLAHRLVKAGRAWRNLPEAVNFLTLVLFGLFGFVRALNSLLNPVVDLFDEGWTLSAFIIVLTLFSILNLVSCVFLNQERTNRDLLTALEEVKALSGLIPICAGCKKIRDDSGYWNQLEGYLAERTGARFSHGLCPDCALEYYPEAKDQIEELTSIRRPR